MSNQIHPTDLYIDKEGIWYFRNNEMKRQDIIQYFYRYLKRDGTGRYLIEIGDDCCYVEVEDKPYVVRSVSLSSSNQYGDPYIVLTLNDGYIEQFDLKSPLRIGLDNVLYCKVKYGEHEARFSRPAYYQFCNLLSYDAQSDKYSIVLNRFAYPLVLIEFRTVDNATTGKANSQIR
jgi:uncharacterized protein